jgi:hypothetical protein
MPSEMTHKPAARDAAAPDHGGDVADDHGDDHAHTAAAIGPIDVEAWGALLLGIALALIVALSIATVNIRAG